MPWSSLPTHLNSPDKWKGTDNDVWYMRWEILTKGWFAFSYRAKEWWARWRKYPKTLFAVKGNGPWRVESDRGDRPVYIIIGKHKWRVKLWSEYLSRIQYWTRWHFQISWPFMIAFHVYYRAEDVPQFPERPKNMSLKKMLYFYGPIHYDSDGVFWLFSFFIGGTWK